MAAEIPFRIFRDACDYGEILEFQENLRNDVIAKNSSGCVLFLEHKPVYTSGLRGRQEDFIKPVGDVPVYNIRRGGDNRPSGFGQMPCDSVNRCRSRSSHKPSEIAIVLFDVLVFGVFCRIRCVFFRGS